MFRGRRLKKEHELHEATGDHADAREPLTTPYVTPREQRKILREAEGTDSETRNGWKRPQDKQPCKNASHGGAIPFRIFKPSSTSRWSQGGQSGKQEDITGAADSSYLDTMCEMGHQDSTHRNRREEKDDSASHRTCYGLCSVRCGVGCRVGPSHD